MAKKKITKSNSAAPRASRKQVNGKNGVTVSKSTRNPKTDAARSSSSAKPVKPPIATKPTKRASATSVDAVLKKYQKERVSLNSSLVTVRKKIDELNAKTRAFEEQISKLTEKEMVAEESLQNLDVRRDAEVSELLSKLGVNIGASGSKASASRSTSQPSSAASQSSDDDSAEPDHETSNDAATWEITS
jgi:hypothetical protein